MIMPSDIKGLLDSIINNTNNSYPDKTEPQNNTTIKFDKGEFRERMSMYVLKDIICAMMHDETKDLDHMIDESIMKHIHDNYNGSCYCYLKNSRDRLSSPILGDIIQEIDNKTEEVAKTISEKKDPCVAESVDVKVILKDVTNYDELREKLKEQVSQQVVDDVTKVITTSNDAPVFDDLDEKLEKDDQSNETPPTGEDVTNESVILRMCGSIVTESAINGNRISTEEGMNRAIVEYCIAEMDTLFKQRPKVSIYAKYL